MSTGLTSGSNKPLCRLVGKEWVISGDPYVLTRLLSIFPLACRSKQDDSVYLPATPEQSRDLLWFAQRYPLRVEHENHLRKQAALYALRHSKADRILSEGYQGRSVQFARGKSPRPYQIVAADLWRSVGSLLLGDDLGLGKTISAITALTDENLRPAVVVCPPHLVIQWRDVIAQFTPELTSHIIRDTMPYSPYVLVDCRHCGATIDRVYQLGGRKKRCPVCQTEIPLAVCPRPADVYLLSYSKLQQWPDNLAKVCRSVVYDEVHGLRGGSRTERWKAARRLSQKMDYRMGMSATPFANLGGEAFNVLECLMPGFLGTEEQFQTNWCTSVSLTKAPPLRDPDAFGNYLKEQKAMLRRTAVELGLPVHDCSIHYRTVEADSKLFNDATTKAEELARALLQDVSSNRGAATMEFDSMLRQATGLAKVDAVASMVREFTDQGEKVVLFAWHQRVHDLLMEKLSDLLPVRYTGSETKEQKAASVNKFVTGDSKVFLMSLRAGEGLDGLQFVSCTAVVAELDWTWAVVKQNVGRIARSGQTRPCNAYFAVTEFGSDPIVSQVLGIKKDQLNGFLGEKMTGPQRSIDDANAIKLMAKSFLRSRAAV